MEIWKNIGKSEKVMKKDQMLLKKARIDEQLKNNDIFWISSCKYGKTKKKVKNDEKGSDIDEKGQNWWKMKIIIFFGLFHKNMEKCRKKWKMMKKGQILLKKA